MNQKAKGNRALNLFAATSLLALSAAGDVSAQSSSGNGAIIPPPPPQVNNGAGQPGFGPAQGRRPGFQPQNNGFQPPQVTQGQPPSAAPNTPQVQRPPQTVPQPGQPPVGQADDGLPDRVTLFSSSPIDQVFMNGKPADGVRVSDTVVQVFIVGDETGYPCTNTFDVTFGDGQMGKLTANHCHGDVEFSVIAGQTLNAVETHDGNIDERSSGIDTLSSDFEWSYFENSEKTGLQFGVPETDNVVFFAECQRGTSNATVYAFVAPGTLQANQPLDLSVVIDGGATENYAMAAFNFPYLEAGLVPAMQIGANHPFFEDLAGGQIADFYVSSSAGQAGLRYPLKGSAKPVRSFAAACKSR
ncbi:MAG: hypothetical protein ABJO09_03330 [Hyphomicrobiales bacterium]